MQRTISAVLFVSIFLISGRVTKAQRSEREVINKLKHEFIMQGWIFYKGTPPFGVSSRPHTSWRLPVSSNPPVYYRFMVFEDTRKIYYFRRGRKKEVVVSEAYDPHQYLVRLPEVQRPRRQVFVVPVPVTPRIPNFGFQQPGFRGGFQQPFGQSRFGYGY